MYGGAESLMELMNDERIIKNSSPINIDSEIIDEDNESDEVDTIYSEHPQSKDLIRDSDLISRKHKHKHKKHLKKYSSMSDIDDTDESDAIRHNGEYKNIMFVDDEEQLCKIFKTA